MQARPFSPCSAAAVPLSALVLPLSAWAAFDCLPAAPGCEWMSSSFLNLVWLSSSSGALDAALIVKAWSGQFTQPAPWHSVGRRHRRFLSLIGDRWARIVLVRRLRRLLVRSAG